MKNLGLATPLILALAVSAHAQESGFNEGDLLALDADGDASISMQEYEAFTSFAFEQMDTNKNGTLSKSEFEAHTGKDAFGGVDTNGNGSISSAEFKARMDANFKAADKDGDGKLD
jgi:hypothetical protein